jgi:hypothetical protein
MADGFTDFLSQAASQLGSGFNSGVSTLTSGAGAIGSTISGTASGSANYLSQLAQQAYAPRPELSTPSRTLSGPSNINIPSFSQSPTGDFGTNFNFGAFNTAPQLTTRSTAPSITPSQPTSIGGAISGFGDSLYSTIYGKTPQQESQRISSVLSTPSPAITPMSTIGAPSIQEPSRAIIAPAAASTQGTLTIKSEGALAKPVESYLNSLTGYSTDIGDTKSKGIIGTTQYDTWSTPGQKQAVQITDMKDALEFKRQQSIAGENPDLKTETGTISRKRAADYYQMELNKLAENQEILAGNYHYEGKKTGVNVGPNPYENAADAALAFMKGGNPRDDFTKNYAFNPAVTGTGTGVVDLLPGGKGLQETAWDNTINKTSNKISNFLPAIAAWRSAEGSMGPYATLGSYTSEGTKIPVPAENIAKMPQAYQDALQKIASGQRDTAGSTYTIPDYFGSNPIVTIPEITTPGGTPISKTETPLFAAKPGEFGTVEMKPGTSNGLFAATAGEITPIGTPTGAQKFVVDDKFQFKENMIKQIDTQKGDLADTQKAFLAAGGKGTYDAQGNFKFEADSTNPTQVALGNDILTKSAKIQANVDTANALPLTAASTGKPEDKGLWENTNEWIGTNITKKLVPEYTSWGGGVINALSTVTGKGTTTELAKSGEATIGNSPFKSISGEDQIKAYLAGDKGYMATVINPETGQPMQAMIKYGNRPTVDLTGWLDVPQAAGASLMGGNVEPGKKFSDIVPMKIEPVSAMNAFWNMPREKPLEAAMYYGTPIGLGAGEAGLAWLGTKGLASSTPFIATGTKALTQSTLLPSLYKGGSYALMGQMGTQEVLKAPGYSFDVLAPLSGKSIISRTITGYDEAGKPIYAEQTPEATSARFGESAFSLAAMGLGAKTAGQIRWKSPGELPSRENLGVVEKAEGTLSKVFDVAFSPSQWRNAPEILKTPLPEGAVLSGSTPTKADLEKAAIDITRIKQPTAVMETTLPAAGEAGIIAKGGVVRSTGMKDYGDIGVGIRDSTGKIDLNTVTERVTTKDLDLVLGSTKGAPESQLQFVADENAKAIATNLKSSGMKDVQVTAEPIYKDQWGMFKNQLTKIVGEKNPESFTGFRYNIKGEDTVTGLKTDTKIDSLIEADVKISSPLNPLSTGQNSRLSWWGMVREPKSVGDVPFQGIGSALFGRAALKQESAPSEYYNVPIMGKSNIIEGASIKVPSTSISAREDVDAFQSVLQTGTLGGKYWNEHVPEVGKVALKLQIRSNLMDSQIKGDMAAVKADLAAGKITQPKADAQLKILEGKQKDVIAFKNYVDKNVIGAEFYGRMTPTGKVEKINVREQALKVAEENAGKLDELIFPSIKIPMTSTPPGISSGGLSSLGGVSSRPSAPSKAPSSTAPSSAVKSSGGVKSSAISSGVSKILSSATKSSGTSELISLSSIASPVSSFGSLSSPPSPKPSSGGSKGSSGSSSSSSSSISSFYSSPSPSSSSPSSVSSSSSLGSRSSFSSGSAFGAPFLAPPGGGGGGGGGRGHASQVIKNPLAELKVASASAFKRMFDFSAPNKLAKDVSGGLRQTQPYGTLGAASSFSKGASSSIQEATNLGIPASFKEQNILRKRPVQGEVARPMMRKSKKSKPKAKSGKKKGTYK